MGASLPVVHTLTKDKNQGHINAAPQAHAPEAGVHYGGRISASPWRRKMESGPLSGEEQTVSQSHRTS